MKKYFSNNGTGQDGSESETEGYRFGDITRGVFKAIVGENMEPEPEPEPEPVNEYFLKADKDKDGVISESEMLNFFKGILTIP